MLNGYYDEDVLPNLDKHSEMVQGDRAHRGHSKQLYVKKSNSNLRANSFTRRIVPLWNSLPEELLNAKSVDSFKIGLDKLWTGQPVKYKRIRYIELYF